MNCPHCTKNFDDVECLTEPGAPIREGDIGVCSECQGWWQMIDGNLFSYEPTDRDRELAQ